MKWSYTSLSNRDAFTYTSTDVIATAWVGTHLPQRIITIMGRN